ncbi:stage VI sporulation protein D [Metabacillus sp. GX 13764]|uniref:stage VI sporulation protein D n=1 Tax=Metabacillus kandeliae TaxID=2900151 RepID=UPI001E4BDB2B|nr:stage VI sporulation protein D [Metabacillus kandeliae]MCD7032894.1 stage VI sporulation protein D [Metabacillus kandeliae]
MFQDDALRFSVEESVWFQKGQEVQELLSIALDPDISIQEHDQYVSIKGALLLTGEYKKSESPSEEPFEYTNARYVQETADREDGTTEMSHRFPVDITIPKNRIPSLDEVFVTIETFDYELPEADCLKLLADLSINGVSRQSADYMAEEPAEHHGAYPETPEYDPAYGEEAAYEPEPAMFRGYTLEAEADEAMKEQAYNELFMDDSERDSDESELYTPFEVEVRKTPAKEVTYFSHAYEEEQAEESSYQAQASTYKERHEQAAKAASEEPVRTDENALYLTKIFTRDDEEEFSRVKMCIVQQGESIDSICEKYDVTVQQLMRVNRLGADKDIYEGLILYIPDYADLKS